MSVASQKLKQLRRMCSFLNTKAATLVYKNMILPVIKYGDIFLVGATVENRKKLQILQNKGLRCALNRDIETIVKNAKSEFIKENLNEHQNDSKKFWKTMSTILPTGKQKNTNKILLKDNMGNIIEDNKKAAGVMNDFFTSIGPNLAANHQDPWNYSGKIIENNIDDIRTNRIEISKLLKEININKSSAIPNLSSKVLKPACLACGSTDFYV